MKKQLNLAVVLFLFLCNVVSYAQIGVGTEQPTYDFEATGTVRFRDLEKVTPYTHYRQVRSDNDGHLTAIQLFAGNYVFKDLIKKLMPERVTVPLNMPQDLGVKIRVELQPQTETMLIVTYNVPVYLNLQTAGVKPHFGGIRLMKKEGSTVETLYGGSRKFSFPAEYPGAFGDDKRGLFIDGKYVEVIKNASNAKRIIEYSLTGTTEGSEFTAMFFGDSIQNQTMDSMGVGVFSIMIFEENLF